MPTKDELENQIYEKMSQENAAFLAEMKTKSPDEIISRAYESIPCHSFIRTGSPTIRMRWMPFVTALRAVRMIFCGKESKKNIEIPRSPYILIPVLRPWFAERSLSGWPAGIGR